VGDSRVTSPAVLPRVQRITVNGLAVGPNDAPAVRVCDSDADVVGAGRRLDHRDGPRSEGHVRLRRVVHKHAVADSERVPLEPSHVEVLGGRFGLMVGEAAAPRSASRQVGHSHHSGRAVECNVGSAGKLPRHRPHTRTSSSSSPLRRGSDMTLLTHNGERRRACVRGNVTIRRPLQTRRPYQVRFHATRCRRQIGAGHDMPSILTSGLRSRSGAPAPARVTSCCRRASASSSITPPSLVPPPATAWCSRWNARCRRSGSEHRSLLSRAGDHSRPWCCPASRGRVTVTRRTGPYRVGRCSLAEQFSGALLRTSVAPCEAAPERRLVCA